MLASFFFVVAASTSAATDFPTMDLSGLFTTDDYPPEALRKMQQGTVNVRVKVDSSGTIVNCIIAKSSETASLDSTTCAVIRARAHYAPVPEPSRHDLVRTNQVKIKWVIPRDEGLPVADAYTRYSFDLSATGQLSSCAVEFNGKPWKADYCEETIANFQKLDQATRDDFVSQGKKFAFLDGHVVGGDNNGSLLTTLAGRGHVEGMTTLLSIDEKGSVTQCKIVFYDWSLDPGYEDAPCRAAKKEKFAPLDKSETNRGARLLTKISAVVLYD